MESKLGCRDEVRKIRQRRQRRGRTFQEEGKKFTKPQRGEERDQIFQKYPELE